MPKRPTVLGKHGAIGSKIRLVLSGEEAGAGAPIGGTRIPEGAKSRVEVDRYELDPVARGLCLEHFNNTCQACGLQFEDRCGHIGHRYMHVHDKTPLPEIADHDNDSVDPRQDLVAVCLNSHAMLHRPKGKTLTVTELRRIMDAVEATE